MTKKLLVVFAVAVSMISTSAFAKTQGNYIGLDAVYTNDKAVDSANNRRGDRNLGAGVSYKYALNFNNFFIAPVAFFNSNNSKVTITEGANSSVNKLKYSYGAKLDLGYDITDRLAVFVSGGYGELRRHIEVSGTSAQSLNTYEAAIYGAGIKYSLDNMVDLNLAYEYFDYNNVLRNDTNIDQVKLGLSFNF